MTRATYLPVNGLYLLNNAGRWLRDAFDETAFLVGSSLERPDYRDVDVRLMLDGAAFDARFPDCPADPCIEPPQNAYWSLICVSISEHLSRQTGLPIDFQVQRRDHANATYNGRRHPLGMFPYQYDRSDQP